MGPMETEQTAPVPRAQQSRPYRSKRHRPCDVCRRRKHACLLEGPPPCRVCQDLGTACTFEQPPNKRRRKAVAPMSPAPAEAPEDCIRVDPDTDAEQGTEETDPCDSANPEAIESQDDDDPEEERSITSVADIAALGRNGLGRDLPSTSYLPRPQQTAQYASAQRVQAQEPNYEPRTDAFGSTGGLTDVHQGQRDYYHQPQLDPAAQPDSVSQGPGFSHHTFWLSMLEPAADDWLPPMNDMGFGDSAGGFGPGMEPTGGLMPGTHRSAELPQIPPSTALHEQQVAISEPLIPSRRDPGGLNVPEQTTPAAASTSATAVASRSASAVAKRRAINDFPEPPLSSQMFGSSAEMDPYLLAKMNFSTHDTRSFGQFQFRNITGCHDDEQGLHGISHLATPAQFMIYAPKKLVDARETSDGPREADAPPALNELVSPGLGARLIGLFFRYTFPSLPVLSRSRLQVRDIILVPKTKLCRGLPPYLLAAVYALSYRFRRYDPVWVLSDFDDFAVSKLWTIAYQGITANMNSPSISLLQTLLICLQRPSGEVASQSNECPAQKNFMSLAVSVAHQLGLYQDCAGWKIPDWERRLRRRLWWVTYSEAAWRSLVLGTPQLVSSEQWDVSPLEDGDFVIDHLRVYAEETGTQQRVMEQSCTFCHSGHDFRFLARLALVADDVYRSLYSVSAVKRVRGNLVDVWQTARDLLQRLHEWRLQVPSRLLLDHPGNPEERDYFHAGSASHLRLSHLTLEMLIRRAMLRAPLILERQVSTPGSNLDASCPSNSAQQALYGSEYATVFAESLDLMKRITAFTHRLIPYDQNSFTFSWSRACFASCSNFVLLLLVQAQNREDAHRVLGLLARWAIALREQSTVFDSMRLALLQLDAVLRLGLDRAFKMAQFTRDCIEQQMPKPSALK